MTSIASSIIVLSASLFTASLIKILAPSGNTEKILRLVISLFLLICIVTCIKSISDNINISEINFSESNETYLDLDQNVLKTTGDYMVNYTEKLLKSQEIEASKIKLTVDSDEKGVISITELNIYLDREFLSEKQIVTELIEKDLNITPNIIIEE